MASKRHVRRKACVNKRKYASKEIAESNRHRLIKSEGYSGHITTYKCTFCGKWHIGHTPVDKIKNIPNQTIFTK